VKAGNPMKVDALSINDRFRMIVSDVLSEPKLDSVELLPNNDVSDGDSLAQLKLILAVEEEFNIRFSLSEMTSLRSVPDFVSAISARIRN